MAVEQYLSLHGCAAGRSKLYDSGFVVFIRGAHSDDNSYVFIRGQVLAEMRKGVTYLVDIKLSNDSTCNIIECQCECAAGVGPSAHCKHVCAILYAVNDITVNGNIKLKLTCIQKIQSFHKAKKFLGSPVKASSLNLASSATDCNGSAKKLCFDPRPDWHLKSGAYEAYFRSTTINYKGHCTGTLPVAQLYMPADVHCLEAEHDYCASCLSDIFLSDIGVTAITDEHAACIEVQTRGQSKNCNWFSERRVRLHASVFHRICKAHDKGKLATELTSFRRINTAAVKHGRKFEAKAISEFESRFAKTVQQSGIVVNRQRPYLACSPDGLVESDSLLEVKCPFVVKGRHINPETVEYIYLDEATGNMALYPSHQYYYQIQGQLYVTSRRLCYFAIYTFCDFVVIEVPRDDDFIAEMTASLDDFFHTHFKPAVLRKFFYRT